MTENNPYSQQCSSEISLLRHSRHPLSGVNPEFVSDESHGDHKETLNGDDHETELGLGFHASVYSPEWL